MRLAREAILFTNVHWMIHLLVYKKTCNSMRAPVMSSTIANSFFSMMASSLAAREAPMGAHRTLRGTMHTRPVRLTRP